MLSKILIANRGEIAVRIIRACREMAIRTVAVFSEADRGSLHVRYADEAHCIGPAPAAKSYLNMGAILEAAVRSGARAIHPGYGFLAENPAFAALCAEEGFVFIGPPAEAIQRLGSKTSARRLAVEAGVPVVPGTTRNLTDEEAEQAAREMGLPVVIKADGLAAGKGGAEPTRRESPGPPPRATRTRSSSPVPGPPPFHMPPLPTAALEVRADGLRSVVRRGPFAG